MPTKRKRLNRAPRLAISDEAIEAYKNREFENLDRALRLRPWEYCQAFMRDGVDPLLNTTESRMAELLAIRSELVRITGIDYSKGTK